MIVVVHGDKWCLGGGGVWQWLWVMMVFGVNGGCGQKKRMKEGEKATLHKINECIVIQLLRIGICYLVILLFCLNATCVQLSLVILLFCLVKFMNHFVFGYVVSGVGKILLLSFYFFFSNLIVNTKYVMFDYFVILVGEIYV